MYIPSPHEFVTPPQNQGQIVVVSYALTPEGIIQRVYDLSDHSEAYYATPWTPRLERWADSFGPENSAPPTTRWKKITHDALSKRLRHVGGDLGAHDTWQDTWNWAAGVWGDDSRDYSMNQFFRRVASTIATQLGLEEVGSSDVWHLTYRGVESARKAGVRTRDALKAHVLDYYGVYVDGGLGASHSPSRARVHVYSYDTGRALPGRPSVLLVRESFNSLDGAVPAYRDEKGVWQYVRPDEVEHYQRNLRLDVSIVYVD